VLIENSFTVARPVDEVWNVVLDVDRIAPCMPGAEITETIDDRTWKGKVNMRFGPVALSFAGSVHMDERDDAAHRVLLHARGTEQKGKGAADAKVTSWLEPAGDGTTVRMEADITLTGAAAQLSRGLLPEVSMRLTQQFADCLAASMRPVAASGVDASQPETTEVPMAAAQPTVRERPATSEPVGGIRLGLGALWATIVALVRRIFGGSDRAG
jgi:carbon monoxide dehydrogenase subunit G